MVSARALWHSSMPTHTCTRATWSSRALLLSHSEHTLGYCWARQRTSGRTLMWQLSACMCMPEMRLLAKDRPASVCINAHSGGSEPATQAQCAQTTVIERTWLATSQELTRHALVINAKQQTDTDHQKACSSLETRCVRAPSILLPERERTLRFCNRLQAGGSGPESHHAAQ